MKSTPWPDTVDCYRSLPLYYSIQQDDPPKLEKQFTKGSVYFTLRNYKYETVFHIAAKNNVKNSLWFTCGRSVFINSCLGVTSRESLKILIINSEGIGAFDEYENHDTRIFLLAVLLSSSFIYNSMGTIDVNARNNLSLIGQD
jgi:hypothetical protein